MWKVVFTKQAAKDAKKLKAAGLDGKTKKLIDVVRKTLLQPPPAYVALVGNLSGYYSRRISIQHRFVYSIEQSADAHDGAPCDGIVKVVRMWSHYEGLRVALFEANSRPPPPIAASL